MELVKLECLSSVSCSFGSMCISTARADPLHRLAFVLDLPLKMANDDIMCSYNATAAAVEVVGSLKRAPVVLKACIVWLRVLMYHGFSLFAVSFAQRPSLMILMILT